jgi:hypothetical protein
MVTLAGRPAARLRVLILVVILTILAALVAAGVYADKPDVEHGGTQPQGR